MENSKKCSKCKLTKVFAEFNINSNSPSGLTSQCKCCKKIARELASETIKLQKKIYYETNKELVASQGKEYRSKNIDKCKIADRLKYDKNKESIKKRVSQYQKDFPDINRKASKKYRDSTPHLQRAKTAKRRAKQLQATPSWTCDEFEILYLSEIYHLAQLRNVITGNNCHVDHIVPLISDKVCGLHCSANLQLLPELENLVKSNKYWPDMWLENET